MRLWSICPTLLDRKGLGGCWVEALLCQAVLAGKTKGYKNHPQVTRWSTSPAPLEAIGVYLAALQREATSRGYHYNAGLILHPPPSLLAAPAAATDDDAQEDTIAVAHSLPPLVPTPVLEVTQGQVEYEMQHLLKKLSERDPDHCARIQARLAASGGDASALPVHPCFSVVPGSVADWEVVQEDSKKSAAKGSKKGGGTGKAKAKAQATAPAAGDVGTATAAAASAAAAGTKRATHRSNSSSGSSTPPRTIPIAEMHDAGAFSGKRRSGRRLRSRSEDGAEEEEEEEEEENGGDNSSPAAAATTVAVEAGKKRKRTPSSSAAAAGNSTATTTTTAVMLMVMQEQEGQEQEQDEEPPARRSSRRHRHIDVK